MLIYKNPKLLGHRALPMYLEGFIMRLEFTEITNRLQLRQTGPNTTMMVAMAKERLRNYQEIRDGGVLTDDQAANEKAVQETLADLFRADLQRVIAAAELELLILITPGFEEARAAAEKRLSAAKQALAELDAMLS